MRTRRRDRGRLRERSFLVAWRGQQGATVPLKQTLVETALAGFDAWLSEPVARALACLRAKQKRDGYWCGELGADTTLESDYVFYLFVLRETSRVHRLAKRIRRH